MGRKLAYLDLRFKHVRVINRFAYVNDQPILHDGAQLLVAVAGGFAGYVDQTAFLELFDVAGEGAVADI